MLSKFIFCLLLILFTTACQHESKPRKLREPLTQNLVLIGWDGADRSVLVRLIKEKKLPNLQGLISAGSFVPVDITQGATETKPGWSQILTGYNTDYLGVLTNDNYAPIPAGKTVLERLQAFFGRENISTFFVAAKQANISARGPHQTCINCIRRDRKTREQLMQWTIPTSAPTEDGSPQVLKDMPGDPYYHLQPAIDFYIDRLNAGENVLRWTAKLLRNVGNNRFFMFVHFEDPDEGGHRGGRSSQLYQDAIIRCDEYLGKFLAQLKQYGQAHNTVVMITADHGFDKKKRGHKNAPYVFLASNSKLIKATHGDRRDITPTIYDFFGIDVGSFSPPLNGKSLLNPDDQP